MSQIEILVRVKKSKLIEELGNRKISLGEYYDLQIKLNKYREYLYDFMFNSMQVE